MRGELRSVGKAELRKDAQAKVKGEARYVGDLALPDLRHGLVLRSPHHHARIKGVDATLARSMPGVLAVITADDIPGCEMFGPILQDQPPLAVDVVRHLGEPVALVVAETRNAAERALEAVRVDYEPLPAVFDPRQALEPGAPQVHLGGNLAASYDVADGDVDAGMAQADVVLEASFSVPRVSPAYLEPESALAQWHQDGTLTVWVSSQKPFEDRDTIAQVLDVPAERIQVKLAVVGGAFGGKEDSEIAVLAALAAWASRSTVRLVNTRHESFLGHPKRHPARLHYRIGARRDGTLVALAATVHMDTGAYASYGPPVGSLLTEVVPGAYRIPNVHARTYVVYTNSPLSGAMRGFGTPQAHFAVESLMDMLAARLGMDPLELRRKNVLRPGDRLFTRVPVGKSAESLPQCLEHVAAAREQLRRIPPSSGMVSGVGFALSTQSMGLGNGVPDPSTNRLEWQPNGEVLIYLGAPDLGQGHATAAEQFVAEALGLPYGAVHSVAVDTDISPYGGVICASRMTYMVGNSVATAAHDLVDRLLEYAARTLAKPRQQFAYEDGHIVLADGSTVPVAELTARAADEGVSLRAEATSDFPYPPETTPQHLPVGMPHVLFCYGAQVVRVEIDPELGTIRVTDVVAIHDVGRVVNRVGLEGQIEGGVAMAIGYALYENVKLKDNGAWTDSFAEYLLPTSKDVPRYVESIVLEVPEASGPYGVKGIGEMPTVPTAPAIANAVYDAIGVRVTAIPITPEAIARME